MKYFYFKNTHIHTIFTLCTPSDTYGSKVLTHIFPISVKLSSHRESTTRNSRLTVWGHASRELGCIAFSCHPMCFVKSRGTTNHAQSGPDSGIWDYDSMPKWFLWYRLRSIMTPKPSLAIPCHANEGIEPCWNQPKGLWHLQGPCFLIWLILHYFFLRSRNYAAFVIEL